jgi:hypothetical protein
MRTSKKAAALVGVAALALLTACAPPAPEDTGGGAAVTDPADVPDTPSEPVTLNILDVGPWWFINTWLTVHMHKRLGFNLFAQRFPRDIAKDHELEEEESATRSPLNYGEAAIVLPSAGGKEDQVS